MAKISRDRARPSRNQRISVSRSSPCGNVTCRMGGILRRYELRDRHCDQTVGELIREFFQQKWRRDVVDRGVRLRPSLRAAVMRVAVKYRRHAVAVDRLLEPRRPEKRHDLRRLTFDG